MGSRKLKINFKAAIPIAGMFTYSSATGGPQSLYLPDSVTFGVVYMVAAIVIYALARSFDMSKVVSLD